jgi:serine/threonine protein kinase
MRYVEEGDLRKYILSNLTANSWANRIDRLWGIAIDLRTLHLTNFVHRDLHSGNVLFGSSRRSFIADFGLACKDGQAQGSDAKGVLPYVAPEVLRRQPYTKAADVYSFGIIMWEFTSYHPPFCDRAYDYNLAIEINNGLRPSTIKGTPECYAKLMKQCWDPKPDNRPTAHFLAETLEKWHHILSGEYKTKFTDEDDIRDQFNLAEQKRQKDPFSIQPYSKKMKIHPSANLTSRMLPTVALPFQKITENRKLIFLIMIINLIIKKIKFMLYLETGGYKTSQYEFTVDDIEKACGEVEINEDE